MVACSCGLFHTLIKDSHRPLIGGVLKASFEIIMSPDPEECDKCWSKLRQISGRSHRGNIHIESKTAMTGMLAAGIFKALKNNRMSLDLTSLKQKMK